MYESQAENIVQEQDTITEVKTVSKPKSVKQQIATGKKKKKRKLKKSVNYVIELGKRIGIGAVILWVLLTFVFGITVLRGNYMFPALRDGDLVITYKLQKPLSSQVVAYKIDKTTRIGRIVAMSGDVVEITESGELIVNGSRISEEIFYATSPKGSAVTYPYTVPDESVFVLNDYRTLEDPDSRIMGAIKNSDLKGVVSFVLRRRGF